MPVQAIVLQAFRQLFEQFLQEEAQRPAPPLPVGPQQPQDLRLQRLAFGYNFYLKPRLVDLVQWVQRSKETTNFTYDLTALNLGQLAGWVDAISGCGLVQARHYIEELRADQPLREHLNRLTLGAPDAVIADLNMGYGRRLGWYALVRALRPALVVETGVDKGLGSCVLAAALLRNREEGHQGRYLGTDINPQAGWLFKERYQQVGEILYGDSIASLEQLSESVDLFINDSDHSAEYEEREYACIEAKLAAGAVLLGDNAHVTTKLYDFAVATGRRYLFFGEKPADHWYPGAGIGAAWNTSAKVVEKLVSTPVGGSDLIVF